jgi:hypothetical protein
MIRRIVNRPQAVGYEVKNERFDLLVGVFSTYRSLLQKYFRSWFDTSPRTENQLFATQHLRHPDLKADYVLANPPFNDSDWRGELLKDDKRWVYGVPPAGNANYAWVQHFVHHLAPVGIAGFVLANGSMSSNQSGEGEIRMAGKWATLTLREAGIKLIDCDHRTPPPVDTGYPYVAIPQLRNGRIDLSGVRRITPEHFAE